MYAQGCKCNPKHYTFVRKIHKSILSMTEITLTEDQIKSLRFYLKGHGAMQQLVRLCDEKNICSRGVTYDAVRYSTYDGENPLHRLVVNEALNLLKEKYSVTFQWAEIQPNQVEA